MRPLVAFALLLAACAPGTVAAPTITPVVPSVSPEPTATAPPSRAAAEAAGCPVTLPASSWIADLAGFTPLPASRFAWYGDRSSMAVDLPIDGVYRINAESPSLSAKVAWWRYVPGTVEITARRIDNGSAVITTQTTAGYGTGGFNPSGIDFTSEGCWRVTGSLQGRELTFVIFVRKAATGEANP
jgi:hypothetical protein